MIKFYGYKKCGTSRKAEKALTEWGIAYQFIDITENPPSDQEMRGIIQKAGLPVKKAYNTSGLEYKQGQYSQKLKTMDEEQMLQALSGKGRLMKRPMVTDGKRATIGFQLDVFQQTWMSKP